MKWLHKVCTDPRDLIQAFSHISCIITLTQQLPLRHRERRQRLLCLQYVGWFLGQLVDESDEVGTPMALIPPPHIYIDKQHARRCDAQGDPGVMCKEDPSVEVLADRNFLEGIEMRPCRQRGETEAAAVDADQLKQRTRESREDGHEEPQRHVDLEGGRHDSAFAQVKLLSVTEVKGPAQAEPDLAAAKVTLTVSGVDSRGNQRDPCGVVRNDQSHGLPGPHKRSLPLESTCQRAKRMVTYK